MRNSELVSRKCGRILRSALMLNNIQEKEAAHLLGVTVRTVQQWMNGNLRWTVLMVTELQRKVFDPAGFNWLEYFYKYISLFMREED